MPYNPIAPLLTGCSVVLADDEPDSLMVAQIMLEMAGAVVITAPNGEEALKRLEQTLPSFIITDISMPVKDGWTLLKNVRAEERLRDLICFALTAHAMQTDRERVYKAGFNGYLTKPIDPATFIDSLVSQLRQYPSFATLKE